MQPEDRIHTAGYPQLPGEGQRPSPLLRVAAPATALLIALVALVVGIVTIGGGGITTDSGAAPASCALPGALATDSSSGGPPMQPAQIQYSSNSLLPPIDAQVHGSLEMATFALG